MVELVKSISRREWKFFLGVLLVLIVLTSLSRIFVFINMPDDTVWSGRIVFSPVDRFVYASYIEQVRDGAFLFEDLYTHEEGSIKMFNVFWLGAGLFARVTGLSVNATLEILRILFIGCLLFVVYLLISFFIKDVWQRKVSFVLATFAGGLGLWLYPILAPIFPREIAVYNLPIDINVAEAFVYLSTYYSAHFIFSWFCFTSIILLSLLAIEKKKLVYAIPSGILGLLLANFHPFTFAVLIFIFLAYWLFSLWKERKKFIFILKFGLIFIIISLPSILYHFYMFKNPWWQNQAWQSNTESPNILFVVVGYGLLLGFALYTLYLAYKDKLKVKNFYFLLVWLLAQFSLIFMPTSVQRRFLEGFQLVLVIFASYSLCYFLEKKKWITKDKFFTYFSFIILFSGSFLFVMILDFKNIYLKGDLIYTESDKIVAMKKLKEESGKGDVVISDIYNSNMLPGVAVRRVFAGHGVETIDYDRKYKLLKAFMASNNPEERINILRDNKIDWFFYDDTWKSDWVWEPEGDNNLEKIYEKGNYKIYKVKK